jgi:hypothetical protein
VSADDSKRVDWGCEEISRVCVNCRCSADLSTGLEDPPISTSDLAATFTWRNFIKLCFGDVAAGTSAVAVGCFVTYSTETFWLGAEQLFWLAVVMVAICRRVARAGQRSERHPFHEDLREILSPLGCSFCRLCRVRLQDRLFPPAAAVGVAARDTRGSAHAPRRLADADRRGNGWVVEAAMIGLGRPGAADKQLLGGDAYLRCQVTSGGPPSDYAKESNRSVGTRLDKPKSKTDARQVILVRWDGEMPNVRMIPCVVAPSIYKRPLAGLAIQTLLSSDPVPLRVQAGLVSHQLAQKGQLLWMF